MRRFIVFIFGLLLTSLLVTGCISNDFSDREVWLYRQNRLHDNNAKESVVYDLFYVYPTLVASKDNAYMDFSDPAVFQKAYDFSEAQSGIFESASRIFVPKVRQLEFFRCMKQLTEPESEITTDEMRPGIEDTKRALKIYLEHYNDRPYILFGHSQGAMDLYQAMCEMPEITGQSNFVAAYLIGLPRVSREKIEQDFAGRGIKWAEKSDDSGVIIVWNSQDKDVANPVFTTPGGYVINPLNWRIDETKADKKENIYARFYDYQIKEKSERTITVPEFCGAKIDLERGALIVDAPKEERFGTAGKIGGDGVYHAGDIWFFAGNINENAQHRVKAWQEKNENDSSSK